MRPNELQSVLEERARGDAPIDLISPRWGLPGRYTGYINTAPLGLARGDALGYINLAPLGLAR
jgi:hypothetical protein